MPALAEEAAFVFAFINNARRLFLPERTACNRKKEER